MKCFNCGDDADMRVLVSINGKIQQVDICSKCYKEQMQDMIEHFKDQGGDFNPEKMQKFMFKVFQENKDDFEKLLSEGFNLGNINLDDIDMKNLTSHLFNDDGSMNMDFESVMDNLDKNKQMTFDFSKFGEDPTVFNFNKEKESKQKVNLSELEKLRTSVNKKKQLLNSFVEKEDYLAAASVRDQIKEMNHRIMSMLEMETENER